MKYEPKILFNPTGKVVEFRCGGQVYIFQPAEKKNLDGFVADHALRKVNTGLEEYIPGEHDVETSSVAYDKMKWKELVGVASSRGIFKPGSKRKEIITKLVELDEQETGALPESSTQEEE